MSKVISTNQISANKFVVNYLVDADEFAKIKESAIDELIKEVKVDGFRKGKAPREKALEKIDPAKIESAILDKTFKIHEKPAVEAGLEEIAKKGRVNLQITLGVENGATREKEDGSFQFQLVFHLMPEIDLSKIATIKIREVRPEEISGRPELSDFIASEKDKIFCNYNRYEESDGPSKRFDQVVVDLVGLNGSKEVFTEKGTKVLLGLGLFLPEIEKNLTGVKKGDQLTFDVDFPVNYPNQDLAGKKIKVKAEVKAVLAPQYSTLEEVFEKSKQSTELQKQFGSAEKLDEYLTNVYNIETNRRLDNIRQRLIIDEVMKTVPDFEMDENLITAEAERIFGNLKKDAEKNKITIGEVVVQAFPIIATQVKDPSKMSEEDAKKHLEKSVREEFKWSNILSFIYQQKVQDKPKPEDFEEVKKSARKEPEKYGFTKDTPKEQIDAVIVDRIVRQIAFAWIVNQVLGNSTNKNTAESSAEQQKVSTKKTTQSKSGKTSKSKK